MAWKSFRTLDKKFGLIKVTETILPVSQPLLIADIALRSVHRWCIASYDHQNLAFWMFNFKTCLEPRKFTQTLQLCFVYLTDKRFGQAINEFVQIGPLSSSGLLRLKRLLRSAWLFCGKIFSRYLEHICNLIFRTLFHYF